MKRLLHDPLIHFLLIGAALFIVFELSSPAPEEQENTIVISNGDLDALRAGFTRTWQRPPTEEEYSRIVGDMIRDEIAYREAVAMGLHQDDPIIRKRLRMKMELLLEDMAAITTPTEEELQTFLRENRSDYEQDPQLAFAQVYISSDRTKTDTDAFIARTLEELRLADPDADPAPFGDSIMLPSRFPLSSMSQISREFGREFTAQLLLSKTGTWVGPLQSGYGFHLVFIKQLVPGRDPDLSEIRQAVERDWSEIRRKDLIEQTYSKLQDRYQVIVEGSTELDG